MMGSFDDARGDSPVLRTVRAHTYTFHSEFFVMRISKGYSSRQGIRGQPNPSPSMSSTPTPCVSYVEERVNGPENRLPKEQGAEEQTPTADN